MTQKSRIALLTLGLMLGVSTPTNAQTSSVHIRWTDYGVPHVTATNFYDLGLGYGYAIGRNRLCVLADRAISLRGERSRHYGADGDAIIGFAPTQNIQSDLFYRVQLSNDVVRRAERELSRDALDLADGYAQGLNRFVRTRASANLARSCGLAAIPRFHRSDVVRSMLAIGTIWKGMRIGPSAAESDWAAVPARADQQARNETPPRPVPMGIGSNAWAYGGDVTATGSAIHVANPHTSWDGSNWLLMHQMYLTIPGILNVAGADFVGLPVPIVGFNNDVAWTIEAPLTVKYFVLQKVEIDRTRGTYRTGDTSQALQFRSILIDVKGTNGRIDARRFSIPVSHLGPLYQLPATDGQPAGWYGVTDAGDANAKGLDQYIAMARARDAKQFVEAIENNRGLGVHIIAVEKSGRAIYTEAGPLLGVSDERLAACRLNQASSPDILDGSQPICSLRGPSGLPKLALPVQLPTFITGGIVHNFNNSYHRAVFGTQASGFSSLLGGEDDHDLRLNMSEKRMTEALAVGKVSPDTALLIALDNRNYAAEQWLDKILSACVPPADVKIIQACNVLRAWDRRNDSTSRGPLLFSQIWTQLVGAGVFQAIVNETTPLSPQTILDIQSTVRQAVLQLDVFGVAYNQQWGDQLARQTATTRVPLHGGSGDEGVLNVLQGADLGKDGFANIVSGTGYLQLVHWDSLKVKARTLLVHGQSFDPTSPYYADQLGFYSEKVLVPFPFEEAEVVAATREEIRIRR